MLTTLLLYAVPAFIALFPGLFALWSGKKLLKRLNQPDFAEALQKTRKQTTTVTLCTIVLLVVIFFGGGLWVIMAYFANIVGGFPSRRKIFGETWSFWQYLSFSTRFWTGYLGIWILILLAPSLLQVARPFGWPLAAFLFILTAIWFGCNPAIFPRLLHARPLDRPDLREPFGKVLEQARCETPHLYQAGPQGGHFVNAFALPGLWTAQAVLFSHQLLEALGPREATAIFAHEIAHLEHFTRRRLARGLIALWALIATAAVLTLEVGPRFLSDSVVAWGWFIVVLFGVSRSIAKRKQHEGDSDLRALELCGDPQALIDGLTKIHMLLRQPRRQSEQVEGASSHPSLAKRIQAIRVASGAAAEPVEPLALRAAEENGKGAVLHSDRILWLSGLPSGTQPDPDRPLELASEARSLAYGELRELRLDVARGITSLRTVDRQGRSDSMALPVDSIAAVQKHLDHVDHQLGSQLSVQETHRLAPEKRHIRQVAALGALISLFPGIPWALLPATLLALVKPLRGPLAAAAICAGGGAIFLWLNPLSSGSLAGNLMEGLEPLLLLLMALLAILFGYYGWTSLPPRDTEQRWYLLSAGALLAVAALASLGGLGAWQQTLLPKMHAHLWAREATTFLLSLLGATAILLTLPRKTMKFLAAIPLLIALAVLFGASNHFRESFTEDSFRLAPSVLEAEQGDVELIKTLEVDGFPTDLRLSPQGTVVAIETNRNYDEYPYSNGAPTTYQIMLADGRSQEIAAEALEFVTEKQILTLRHEEDQSVLDAVMLHEDFRSSWQIRFQRLSRPHLIVDPPTGRWLLSGLSVDTSIDAGIDVGIDAVQEHLIRFSGRIGELTLEESSWPLAAEEDLVLGIWYTNAKDLALSAQAIYEEPFSSPFYLLTMFGSGTLPFGITTLKPGGEPSRWHTALNTQCHLPSLAEEAFLCLVSDKYTTQLWTFDGNEPKGVGSLLGLGYQASTGAGGRVLLHNAKQSYLFDLSREQLVKLDLNTESGPEENELPMGLLNTEGFDFDVFDAVALTPSHLAVADYDWNSDTAVRVYKIQP